jgi:putative transposase
MTRYRDKYRVETTRLSSWDYSSSGYYFVTICAKEKQYCFGEVSSGQMELSKLGRAAHDCWIAMPRHFPFAAVDLFVVMPNHVHAIVVIRQPDGRPRENQFGPQSANLGSIVRGYKIGVKKYATQRGLSFAWQARFFEHVIRTEKALGRIRDYIVTNPQRWESDEYYLSGAHDYRG